MYIICIEGGAVASHPQLCIVCMCMYIEYKIDQELYMLYSY
jgi:hypothetical protein